MYQENKIILEEDVIREMEPSIPNLSQDLIQAQMILKQCSNGSGDCLLVKFSPYKNNFLIFFPHIFRYDHLAEVIQRVLCDRPENVMDNFEEYSRKLRRNKFHYEDLSTGTSNQSHSLQNARQIIRDFQVIF